MPHTNRAPGVHPYPGVFPVSFASASRRIRRTVQYPTSAKVEELDEALTWLVDVRNGHQANDDVLGYDWACKTIDTLLEARYARGLAVSR